MNTILLIITPLIKILRHAGYFALSEESKSIQKAPKFKIGDRVRITMYNNILSKSYTKKCLKKYM